MNSLHSTSKYVSLGLPGSGNAFSVNIKDAHDFLVPFQSAMGMEHYFTTWAKEQKYFDSNHRICC